MTNVRRRVMDADKILYAYVKFDQTKSDETQLVSVMNTENGEKLTCPATSSATHPNAAIQALRDNSHLYLGKQTAAGKQLICQLSDTDGDKYFDGSAAAFDGSEGDHWMRIGVPFYVKRVSGEDSGDIVIYGIAVGGQPDDTWKQIVTPNDLLAVHYASRLSSKLYSRSGVYVGASQAYDTYKTEADNRNAEGTLEGTGYSLTTWEWHCVMALLFYAWYGRTNASAQCGAGSVSYNKYTLGDKNSLGMADTTPNNGSTGDVKFWGLENWWGSLREYIGNGTASSTSVTINWNGTKTVKRSMSFNRNAGLITRMLLSEDLDFVPSQTVNNSNYNTYYCAYSTGNTQTASMVLGRSGQNGIVSFHVLQHRGTASISCSRLAFTGEIEIADSVAEYKAATSVG